MPRISPCLLSLGCDLPDEQRERVLGRARKLDFDGIMWRHDKPLLGDHPLWPPHAEAGGLHPLVDIDLARFAIDDPSVASHPALFSVRYARATSAPIDPRQPAPDPTAARARLTDPAAVKLLRAAIVDRLTRAIDAGLAGIRVANAAAIRPDFLIELADLLRDRRQGFLVIGVNGCDAPFDAVTVKSADLPTIIDRYESLRLTSSVFAEIDARSVAAAALADGVMVPASMLEGQEHLVSEALALSRCTRGYGGEMRLLSGAGADVGVILRTDSNDIRQARRVVLIVTNVGIVPQPVPNLSSLVAVGSELARFQPTAELLGRNLEPGEARIFSFEHIEALRTPISTGPTSATLAASAPRLVVESIEPTVAGGDFPVKRIVGETIAVGATIYADGHEHIAAEMLHAEQDSETWTAVRMTQLPNNGWSADFPLLRLGRHRFVIEAWLDRFGGFRRDFEKKLEAGVAQPVDEAEGVALVRQAAARSSGELAEILADWIARIEGAEDRAALLLTPELATAMDAADDRPHRLRSVVQRVDAERLQARYSSWYELFPRSMSGTPNRHGTFLDVIDRLPSIREMGFDTLYFPPIHPIGTTNRKGPNNTLTPAPGDPGSPYAIGSSDGGHDAIHPELGTFEDFAKLIAAAHDHGLEIAIDFAIQCSPDHPWLTEHPDWFAWRPDGSMKYAENPPKKYQDIVNVDFYADGAVPDLWLALRDVVLFWVARGVKTFRVDNPHTKPLPFWEWMIGEVRSAHPEAIFLAEAFTSPAMMYRLAKIGFSQSYTYFTWRDGKQALVEYLTELTTTAPKDFYRPHFFVNTPDINPRYLQTSGRPGFRIRAALAATLSGLFGVYSGFELCEAAALPGREEYLDSEKYQLRQRDWQAPGNIIADIALLNRLRRVHPALQTHLNTRFYRADNDAIIYYAKPEPDGRGMILVMINLDCHHPQEASFEVPLWEFGLPDDGSVAVHDLAAGHRFQWQGKTQWIRLDPQEPYRIWRIAPGEVA